MDKPKSLLKINSEGFLSSKMKALINSYSNNPLDMVVANPY
jgi:hypothetical protein